MFRRLLPVIMLAYSSTWAFTARADHPSAAFGGGGTGPINTIPATTLDQGSAAYAVRLEYLSFRRFTDAQLAAFGNQGIGADSIDFSFGTFLSAAYGLTDCLTVGARFPHIIQNDIREPHINGGQVSVENEGSTAGIGDFLFFSVLELGSWQEDTLQLSLIAGLEIPSGRTTDLTREGDVFELEHQPGSGSWDPLLGLSLSKSWDRLSFHAGGTHLLITEGAQDTALGDIANYNFALAYNLLGHEHGHGDDHGCCDNHGHDAHDDSHVHHDGCGCAHHDQHHGPSLDVIFEWNGIWEEKDRVGGVFDDNSGGHIVYLSPGLRLTLAERWATFVSVGIPIFQNVNGAEHSVDHRIILGSAARF